MRAMAVGLALAALPLSALAGESWFAERKVDPMTDARSCVVSSLAVPGPSLSAWVRADGVTFTAGAGAFPGTHVHIRVDRHAAIAVREDAVIAGEEASRLEAQLEAGSAVTTQHYAWPRRELRIGTAPAAGLARLIRECRAFAGS